LKPAWAKKSARLHLNRKKKKKKTLGVVMHTCHPSRKLKNEGFVVWAGLGKK
jgi:hypothetical protein